ncbi:hypothetical protein [Roseovarius sp. 2305UL8-3]|uniref:hypothetical protein n=1 Tax=Roseovarius conchicola TaxID=3121636 RepID=UPI00352979D8
MSFIAAVILWQNAANAQTSAMYDQSCRDLVKAMEEYYADRDDANLLAVVANDPASTLLDDFMSGLNGDVLIRVRIALEGDFISACALNGGVSSVVPNTVGGHLETIVKTYGFDRSAPDWGLPNVPMLDFKIHTVEDWLRYFQSLPKDVTLYRHNDFALIALTKYIQKYDIQTTEERAIAYDLIRLMSFYETEEEESQPLAVLLDRVAREEGLRLK